MSETSLQTLLKRDRIVVLASLAGICIIAWIYLLHLSAGMAGMEPTGTAAPQMSDMPGMESMPGMTMTAGNPQNIVATFASLAAMWLVMMIGMMLPSAAPTILLFAALERKRSVAAPFGRTALFVSGYFLVWGLFSLAAAAAQTAMSQLDFMSSDMAVTSALAGGATFVLAGIYQFSPLKYRCLTHCRSPLEWIAHHQHAGRLGALRMGATHGMYCVGCCWILMLLLFVLGVMNLVWVAALAVIVLAEKLLPAGRITAKIAGGALVLAGAYTITTAL